MRNRGDVLNTTDLHTSTSEGTEGRLGTGAGGLGSVTTLSPELDVKGSDSASLRGREKRKEKEGGGRRG